MKATLTTRLRALELAGKRVGSHPLTLADRELMAIVMREALGHSPSAQEMDEALSLPTAELEALLQRATLP